jgi:hypothetical protein
LKCWWSRPAQLKGYAALVLVVLSRRLCGAAALAGGGHGRARVSRSMCALFCVFILADVDSQLQMEREFSFHLQLADVAPRLQMEIEFSFH